MARYRREELEFGARVASRAPIDEESVKLVGSKRQRVASHSTDE